MAQRKISSGMSRTAALPVDAAADLRNWLERVAVEHRLTWLLAHCEDGTIWGVVQTGRLELSSEAFPQGALALRWEALVQARLFGEGGEVLVWPGPAGWQARLRDDTGGESVERIDEAHLLWGTASEDPARTVAPFTQLVEGRQGTRHAPPLAGALQGEQRASLLVRHYLEEDVTTGAVHIVDSRLVALHSQVDGL
jgi:CRISPR-associated protein (TIGR03984 family)